MTRAGSTTKRTVVARLSQCLTRHPTRIPPTLWIVVAPRMLVWLLLVLLWCSLLLDFAEQDSSFYYYYYYLNQPRKQKQQQEAQQEAQQQRRRQVPIESTAFGSLQTTNTLEARLPSFSSSWQYSHQHSSPDQPLFHSSNTTTTTWSRIQDSPFTHPKNTIWQQRLHNFYCTKKNNEKDCGGGGGVILFLHVPKTGGTSIRQNLQTPPYSDIVEYTRIVHWESNWTTLQSLMERQLLLPASCNVTINTNTTNTITTTDTTLQQQQEQQEQQEQQQKQQQSCRSSRRRLALIELHGDVPGLAVLHPWIQTWKRWAASSHEPFWTFTVLREPQALQVSYFRHLHRPNCSKSWCEPVLYNLTQDGLRQSLVPNRQCQFLMQGQRENKKKKPPNHTTTTSSSITDSSSQQEPQGSGPSTTTPTSHQNSPSASKRTTAVGVSGPNNCPLDQVQALLQSDWDWVGITSELNQVTLPLLATLLLLLHDGPLQHSANATSIPTMKMYGRQRSPWGELHPSQWSAQTREALHHSTLIDQQLWAWVQHAYHWNNNDTTTTTTTMHQRFDQDCENVV